MLNDSLDDHPFKPLISALDGQVGRRPWDACRGAAGAACTASGRPTHAPSHADTACIRQASLWPGRWHL